MAENPDTGAVPIPPKLDLRKSGILKTPATPAPPAPPAAPVAPAVPASPAPAAAPVAVTPGGAKGFNPSSATVRIDVLGTTPTAPAEKISPAGTPKRETSRISLETVRAPVGGAAPSGGVDGPKTIRIKPGGGPAAPKTPAAATPVPRTVPPSADAAQVGTAKRTTSRVSLENVLGAEDMNRPGGTTTIKLKRPGEAGAARLASGEQASAAGGGQVASPTQKKTVRIKRPNEAPESQTAPAREEEATSGMVLAAKSDDEAHFLFPVFAVISVAALVVLIYVLLAQCMGPDTSLTQLSMGARDIDLPWPGKMPLH